jgi:hypothetical protein
MPAHLVARYKELKREGGRSQMRDGAQKALALLETGWEWCALAGKKNI